MLKLAFKFGWGSFAIAPKVHIVTKEPAN